MVVVVVAVTDLSSLWRRVIELVVMAVVVFLQLMFRRFIVILVRAAGCVEPELLVRIRSRRWQRRVSLIVASTKTVLQRILILRVTTTNLLVLHLQAFVSNLLGEKRASGRKVSKSRRNHRTQAEAHNEQKRTAKPFNSFIAIAAASDVS